MMASQSETPEQDVVQHFTEVFHDAGQPGTVQQLCAIAEDVRVEAIVPFSQEEVREAFLEGKKCKAVGPDGVPLEMLLALIQDECTLQSFVSCFNSILRTGKTLQDWSKSAATLLAKLPQPVQPKQLRPIALASHTSKAFSRLLLRRVGGCLMPKGPKQLACKGRQPTDLVWSSARMVHLAREWGVEMHMIKLDLRRAFDSVYRAKLAERVQAWCQQDFPAETRCLIQLLAAADLILALPWGCYDIHSNTGVKQGATETLKVRSCSGAWWMKSLMTSPLTRSMQFSTTYPVMEGAVCVLAHVCLVVPEHACYIFHACSMQACSCLLPTCWENFW